MNKQKQKQEKIIRRKARIRSCKLGTETRPRLSVFKSNTNIYAQIIDDIKQTTLCAATSQKSKSKKMTEKAKEVGVSIASCAKKDGISKVYFDRGKNRYMGAIKALAEEARINGLIY